MKPIDKKIVSNIDQKLNEFDQKNTKTAAQMAEINKYKQLNQMRDHATEAKKDKDLWDFGNEK